MLGLIINTNRLTVAIPPKYLQEVLKLLNSTWHPNQRCFKVSEAQKLTGKLARLAKGANWVFHLLSHLYSSIAYALSKNKRLLTKSSAEFQDIVLEIRTNAFVTPCKDLARHTSFAMKCMGKLTHHASYQYNINRTMHYKIKFFCNKLKPDSGIKWEMPTAHLIPRTPFATTIKNSLLEGAGGFSITLGFWWHICFPDKVVQCTLQFKTSNDDGMLVSINVLEFCDGDNQLLRRSPCCLDISRHRRSPPCNPQRRRQFFCSVLDTPHVQAIKSWANACSFLLFIVD
jgi:hypothetical protein